MDANMYDNIYQALLVMTVGIIIVFSALTFFYLLIMLLKYADEKINKYKATKRLSPTSVGIETVDVNPEIIAVISAAAYETFHKPIRIKKIRFLHQEEDTSWSRIGRMNVISSHNIFKK